MFCCNVYVKTNFITFSLYVVRGKHGRTIKHILNNIMHLDTL